MTNSSLDEARAVEFQVEDDPDPLEIEFLETQIRREAWCHPPGERSP